MRNSRLIGLALGAWLCAGAGAPAWADSSGPVQSDPAPSSPAASAEAEYNRGLRLRAGKDWPGAVAAFRRATELLRTFPEAWNELGYALRHTGKYRESVAAYEEALRQRPNYAEALEYIGEAYVQMGRVDEARRVLDRLKPLDAARARELAGAISRAR